MSKHGSLFLVNVGQRVEYRTRVGTYVCGLVVDACGDVYKVQLDTGDVKPVHHKFITRTFLTSAGVLNVKNTSTESGNKG